VQTAQLLHAVDDISGYGAKFLVIEWFEVGAACVLVLAELVAVEIYGCAGGYGFVFAGQVAEGEEKVGDDGGDGCLVAGSVDAGGGVDFIGDTDG
jgi:hypothetical protein